MRRLTLGMTAALLASVAVPRASQAEIRQGPNEIVVSGRGYALRLSAANGSILGLTQAAGTESILTSGELGLWQVRFQDGSTVSAADFRAGAGEKSLTVAPGAGPDTVSLVYRGAEIEVTVTVTSRADGVDLVGVVSPREKTVLDFALPARLRFDPERLDRFICPMNGNSSVGAAFRGGFFKLQPQASPTGWRPEPVGTRGYVALYGGPLDQRADQDPPVKLSIPAAGHEWFGDELAGRLEGASATANRPPTRAQADLVLADSPNGPYFSASHLGGQGFLFRLGGGVGDNETGNAADMVTAAARKLAASPGGRTKVGVIALKSGPERGGWTSVPVSEWLSRFRGVAAGGQLEFVALASVPETLAALQGNAYLAVLNPYGEWAPVPDEGGMDATVAAVGRYVRAGGNWFEVGGYPFFYAMRPLRYLSYATPYPAAFADFVHLSTRAGSASVYGVQPQKYAPWEGAKNQEAIFVPGRLGCGGDEKGGFYDRGFGTYVKPGATWRSPVVRIAVGHSAPEDLAAYCQANEIKRRLEDKMTPEVLRRFKTSVLVYYGGSAREKLANLDTLPVPTQIHFADYLQGGFDKQYPDHLPPNPSFGTPEELRAFFDRCHQLGHLVMPYTNPTWWCDHPRGPTFEAAGEAPLLKGLDGKPGYERYAANDGWTICFWHPAVQAANRKTVRQFTDEYPVDILFQDQCGARGWSYDTNPASPTPYAYSDGLISMVAEDCRTKPLSTECGWDRVVNYESQLCGLTWAIVPTEGSPGWRTMMKYEYPPDTWDLFPLAQYIAHDKTALLYHDLGQFVTNREVLAWTLALGFSMSYRASAAGLAEDSPREWLRWLDRLQKSVCARYVGEPVATFEHDRGPKPTVEDDGVVRAAYGPVKLAANLGAASRVEAGRELPGFGFYATAPGMTAADVKTLGGVDYGERGVSFVTEGDARRMEAWVYAPGAGEVAVEVPAGMSGEVSVALEGAPAAKTAVKAGTVGFRLPPRGEKKRVDPPPALAGKAPRDWPGATPALGILDLGPGWGLTWTRTTPEAWVQAFAESPLAKESGLAVRRIGSVEELVTALQAGPTAWLAIVNPYGEGFPETAPGKWHEMLDLIRQYVSNGGSWWEAGGYSFYHARSLQAGAWAAEPVGPGGMGYLGLPVGDGAVEQPAETLRVTPEGRKWLGADLAAKVEKAASVVNRGFPETEEAPPHVTLVAGETQGFIGAYRLQGWGYLWRVGGFWPNPEVALPVAAAAMGYVYTHPALPVPSGGTRYLWHATIAAGR